MIIFDFKHFSPKIVVSLLKNCKHKKQTTNWPTCTNTIIFRKTYTVHGSLFISLLFRIGIASVIIDPKFGFKNLISEQSSPGLLSLYPYLEISRELDTFIASSIKNPHQYAMSTISPPYLRSPGYNESQTPSKNQ